MMFWSIQNSDAVKKKDLPTMKTLNKMECEWGGGQKTAKRVKPSKDKEKKVRDNTTFDILLRKCKEHGGPVTSAREVEKIVHDKAFLRVELRFQKVTHPKDSLARPDAYRINKLIIDEMKNNLLQLLGSDSEAQPIHQ